MSMNYGVVKPSFWTGATGRALRQDVDAQVVALYLMTSPHANIIGVFRCPIGYIAAETGRPIEGASKGLLKLVDMGFCTVDPETETVWIHEMARFQIGETLNGKDKRVKHVARFFADIENIRIKWAFFEKYGSAYQLIEPSEPKPIASPIEGASKPLPSSPIEATVTVTVTNTDTSVPSERAPPAPSDPDAELFRRGREVLGPKAGGQIAKLKAAKGGVVSLARAVIETAASKDKPAEYVAAAILGGAGPPSFGNRQRANGGFAELLIKQSERMNGPATIDHDDFEFAPRGS